MTERNRSTKVSLLSGESMRFAPIGRQTAYTYLYIIPIVLLALFLSNIPQNVVAQKTNTQIALVGRTPMGWSFERAKKSITTEFGKPFKTTSDVIVYKNCTFHGIEYDRAEFKFKNGVFNEARFVRYMQNKQSAQAAMDSIAVEMGKTFGISKDKEDAGRWFYKGGKAPVSVGYLFTIYTYPKQGSYIAELRYGPIQFK